MVPDPCPDPTCLFSAASAGVGLGLKGHPGIQDTSGSDVSLPAFPSPDPQASWSLGPPACGRQRPPRPQAWGSLSTCFTLTFPDPDAQHTGPQPLAQTPSSSAETGPPVARELWTVWMGLWGFQNPDHRVLATWSLTPRGQETPLCRALGAEQQGAPRSRRAASPPGQEGGLGRPGEGAG